LAITLQPRQYNFVTPTTIRQLIAEKKQTDAGAATAIVEALLAASAEAQASDLHLLPTADGLAVSWRLDGVLQPLCHVPEGLGTNVVNRLKVAARLLTYRSAVPQEGRIDAGESPYEVRVSTFPTVFGEKVVCRNLPRGDRPLTRLAELGLPAATVSELRSAVSQTSGALVIAGPAGSGKTTTAYAALREILDQTEGRRSIASLEDPVEAIIPGVAQSQVAEAAGFDLLTGLRSLVRQDPEVIFIGEVRDAETSGLALQAALTGQLVITTFHATDAATAVSRFGEMNLQPYALRSGVRAVVAQRLMRKLCGCAIPDDEAPALLAGRTLASGRVRRAAGCEACRQTGYAGRIAAAEVLLLDQPSVAAAVLGRADATTLRTTAGEAGMVSLVDQATRLVAEGVTSVSELVRVFGLSAASRREP
jgi:type II secretory ATPase GspE/PulE/Tfp pilus assembly ATPase PilB-like protein